MAASHRQLVRTTRDASCDITDFYRAAAARLSHLRRKPACFGYTRLKKSGAPHLRVFSQMCVFLLLRVEACAFRPTTPSRSRHPERGRAPARTHQRGKPESKDLGFGANRVAQPPSAVL